MLGCVEVSPRAPVVAGRRVLPTSSPARGFPASGLQPYLLGHVYPPSSRLGPGSHQGLTPLQTTLATAPPGMCPHRQVSPYTPYTYIGVSQALPPLLAGQGWHLQLWLGQSHRLCPISARALGSSSGTAPSLFWSSCDALGSLS